jgi:hypothetical protein
MFWFSTYRAQAAEERTVVRVCLRGPVKQHANPWGQLDGALRVRRERRCRRAGKQRYDLAPFHCQCFPSDEKNSIELLRRAGFNFGHVGCGSFTSLPSQDFNPRCPLLLQKRK